MRCSVDLPEKSISRLFGFIDQACAIPVKEGQLGSFMESLDSCTDIDSMKRKHAWTFGVPP